MSILCKKGLLNIGILYLIYKRTVYLILDIQSFYDNRVL